ncbi:MAG TPA: glycosyltransferase family A protein, partial [Bacteroidota bacterium]
MRKRTKQRATKKPAVSVVIVSDYASGGTTAWNDVRATLRALAIQNFKEPVEFILSENTEYKKQIPRDLTKILPSLKTILSSAASSYGLKNEGVRAAAADIVALIDADCVPGADWLQRLVDVMRNNPSVAAVSGRTTYAGRNFLERAMALLSRSYLDPGRAGSTRYISNNNAAYRRTVYLAHPLPIGVSP